MLPLLHPSSEDRERILLRLNENEIANPINVMEDFCDEYNIGKVRDKIWELTHTAIMEDERYNNLAARGSLIFFTQKLEKVLEGVFVFLDIAKNNPSILAVS